MDQYSSFITKFKKKQTFIICIYALPILILFVFIKSFSVNVPFGDDWHLIPVFDSIKSGNLSFKLFFSQHNEHRIFFPRIIFAILAFASKWNIEAEVWFSFAISIVSFILIYRISRISFDKHLYLLVVANALSSLIFFSPIQVENWLWGFQISWFLIINCMISAVYFLSSTNLKYKIFISASLCLIASFSCAHGLLTWIALTPLILSTCRHSWKNKLFTLISWYFGFLISVVIYTIGYQKPSSHPDTLFFLKNPVNFLKYFFSLAGSPFNVNQTPIAGILGLLAISLFLYFNYSFIKCLFSKDRNDVSRLFQSKIAPWLSIGWFAVLFVLMTSVGRVGFGVEQAAASRYTSMSNLLFISCLQVGLLMYSQKKVNVYLRKKHFFWQGLMKGLVVALFFMQYAWGISIGSSIGSEYKIQRSHGKQCLELIHYLETDKFKFACLQTLYPDLGIIKSFYPTLEKIDFRDFPKNVEFANTSFSSPSYGNVDYPKDALIKLFNHEGLSIRGWAALPNENDQPTAVFFSYNEKHSFFATAPVYQSRPDIEKALGSGKYSKSGWSGNESINKLPVGDNVIKTWIYSKRANQFIKLNGEITVKVMG